MFVGCPLRQMERAACAGVRSECRDLDNEMHSSSNTRLKEGGRPAHMHVFETSNFTSRENTRGVDYDFNAG